MESPAASQAEERPSLSDTLSAAFDEAKVDIPAAPVANTPVTGSSGEPVRAEPKVDSTGRAHASDGKFAPKTDALAQATPQSGNAPPATTPAAGAPSRPKRPDSWAKEYWDHWDKIDPNLADYLSKRESQYLQGVTTYKQEYERVKPIAEAIQPYPDLVQAVGGAPKFIKALADTHAVLSGQDQQQKLRTFARFAKEYGVALEQLLIQGDDGKVYLNQKYSTEQPPTAQPAMGQREIENIVQQNMAKMQLQQIVANFAAEKDEGGKPRYPHFEKVRREMDGLLRSGLVNDLQGAYRAALNLPQHATFAETERQQREEQERAADAKAKQEAADRAKANIVSTRSTAPTALASAASGKKGLRAALEDAANASLGGGRV